MSDPLHIEISAIAATQVRAAETWWGLNRPKAPSAIRAELERGCSLIALQPHIGARATNIALPGVRRLHLARIHYDLYVPPRRGVPAIGDSGVLACQPWKLSADLKNREP